LFLSIISSGVFMAKKYKNLLFFGIDSCRRDHMSFTRFRLFKKFKAQLTA